MIEAGSNDMVTRAQGWAGASHWRYRAVPQVRAEAREVALGDGTQQGALSAAAVSSRSRSRSLGIPTSRASAQGM